MVNKSRRHQVVLFLPKIWNINITDVAETYVKKNSLTKNKSSYCFKRNSLKNIFTGKIVLLYCYIFVNSI
jgi:hypothetical protein